MGAKSQMALNIYSLNEIFTVLLYGTQLIIYLLDCILWKEREKSEVNTFNLLNVTSWQCTKILDLIETPKPAMLRLNAKIRDVCQLVNEMKTHTKPAPATDMHFYHAVFLVNLEGR